MTNKIRCIAWNVGFSSRKSEFLPDRERASKIIEIVKNLDAGIIALDEMASRRYSDGSSFDLEENIRLNDAATHLIHFESALSLGIRHSNPYGKLSELKEKFGITRQEQGLGIWVREPLSIGNLYSQDRGEPRIEVFRPLPHPLYMGTSPSDEKTHSAGRDEEDRPVLIARIDQLSAGQPAKEAIYFASLHLPTLKNEEKNPPVTELSSRQREILEITLGLSPADIDNVDQLGARLRVYLLRHLISQMTRIEQYWGDSKRCIFILAGDYNFDHKHPSLEYQTLASAGYRPAKTEGATRPGNRLVDNIWVKGAGSVNEVLVNGKHIEEEYDLTPVSDHFPVVADISW